MAPRDAGRAPFGELRPWLATAAVADVDPRELTPLSDASADARSIRLRWSFQCLTTPINLAPIFAFDHLDLSPPNLPPRPPPSAGGLVAAAAGAATGGGGGGGAGAEAAVTGGFILSTLVVVLLCCCCLLFFFRGEAGPVVVGGRRGVGGGRGERGGSVCATEVGREVCSIMGFGTVDGRLNAPLRRRASVSTLGRNKGHSSSLAAARFASKTRSAKVSESSSLARTIASAYEGGTGSSTPSEMSRER